MSGPKVLPTATAEFSSTLNSRVLMGALTEWFENRQTLTPNDFLRILGNRQSTETKRRMLLLGRSV
jgi:hypothetical protein